MPKSATNGPQKRGCYNYKLVAVHAKKNKMASVGSSRNGCATIGRSQPSLHDMPRDKYELEVKSYQNPPDLENWFSMDALLYGP
jgi:hypothetical protein